MGSVLVVIPTLSPRWRSGSTPAIGTMGQERSTGGANAAFKVDPASGLELAKTSWGQILRRIRSGACDGTLSGDGPIYSFTEAIDGISGAWASGPRTGYAAEVNGQMGLGGSVQELHQDRFGFWRLQSIKVGTRSTTPCPLQINLKDYCTGSPISGAVVTIYSATGSTLATGSTDSSGNYTFPSPVPSGSAGWTIAYGGATFGWTSFSNPFCVPVDLCYAHAELDATCDDSESTITTIPSPWTSVSNATPGSATFKYAAIDLCSLHRFPTFPIAVTAFATPPFGGVFSDASGYLVGCESVSVACGADTSVDVPQFKFSDCYFHASIGVYGVCPDVGCATSFGPDNRDLMPHSIQVRLTTVSHPCGLVSGISRSGPLFADDDGQWITLTGSEPGGSTPYLYDSGCRGGNGNFLTLGGVNCSNPYTPSYPFQSTRVILVVTSTYSYLAYTRYPGSGCADPALCLPGEPGGNCFLSLDSEGNLCSTCATTAEVPAPCMPLDTDVTINSGISDVFTVEMRPVSC